MRRGLKVYGTGEWKIKKIALMERVGSGDGAYNTKLCYEAIRIKRAPREGAAFWELGHLLNLAVGCQKLYGSNRYWNKEVRLSQAFTLRNGDVLGEETTWRYIKLKKLQGAQLGETYAMITALNKLTGLDMPENQCIV